MAKDKYVVSSMVDIVGTLDYNQNEDFVIYIEQGRGDNMIVKEINLLDVLKPRFQHELYGIQYQL